MVGVGEGDRGGVAVAGGCALVAGTATVGEACSAAGVFMVCTARVAGVVVSPGKLHPAIKTTKQKRTRFL